MVLYINKISMVDMGTTVLTTKNQKKKYRKGLDYSDKKKWAKGQRIRDKDRKNARHNKYLENNLYAGREYITVKRTNHEKDTPFDYDRVKKEDEQEKAELVYELDQYVELYDYYDTIEEDKMKNEQQQQEWWDEEETKRNRKRKRQEVEKSERKKIKIETIVPQINNIYCKHLGWHQTCDFINKVQSSPKKIYNGFDDEIFIPDAEEWMFGK